MHTARSRSSKGGAWLVLALVVLALAGTGPAPPRPGPRPPRPPRPGPPPGPPGVLPRTVYPVEGPTTLVSRYGPGPKGFHYGVDIGAPRGANALACVAGVVTYGTDPKGGNVAIVVSALDGTAYYYAHLDDFAGSSPGSSRTVEAGDVVGHVGNTGNAAGTAPHLHFELWPSGKHEATPPDPTPFLTTAKRIA